MIYMLHMYHELLLVLLIIATDLPFRDNNYYALLYMYVVTSLFSFYTYVVNGGWSSWTHGSCSTTCGNGTLTLNRSCTNPSPYCGGSYCSGLSVNQTTCNSGCCPGKTLT